MNSAWSFVKVERIRIDSPVANPSPETLQYEIHKQEVAKSMPFLHFHQAIGELEGKWYYANGASSKEALWNLADAAGVFFSGPDPADYFSDENMMKRLRKPN